MSEGKTDISAVVLFFPAGVVWDFDNSMSSWRGLSIGEIGYRWGWKVEAFSVDLWLACLLLLTCNITSTAATRIDNITAPTRGMFARPLAQKYTWCMYMNTYKQVIVSSFTINHPTNLYFILLFYTWFTPWYQGMVHIIYSPSYRSKLYYFLFPKVQFSKNILFPWVKSVEWMVYSWIGLIWFNNK